MNNLSTLSTSHMGYISYLCGIEGRKWYQFIYVGKGSKSGNKYKSKIINDVIEDIKWNVLKEVSRYISDMLFTSSIQNAPSITCIKTNICGNENSKFWQSVGVDNRGCDFLPKYNGCISWWTKSNPYYIYSAKDSNHTDDNHFMSLEINKFTNECLAISAVCDITRKKISCFAKDFLKINRKKALKILKLKTKFDNNIFFESRVLSEYKYNSSEDFEGLYGVPLNGKNNKPILQILCEDLNFTVEKTKDFYSNSKNLYENNISYINTTINFKIQRRAVLFTVISAIATIGSLLLAISSNENLLYYLKEIISNF
ncbi:MAG: hypothetical protein R3Y35_09200 [Clostridia bacterium]